jgi:hypothetical protein
VSVGFDVIDQVAIITLISSGILMERKWECSGTVHHLFIDVKENLDYFAAERVYNILAQFHMLMKPANLELC